jgi:dTDP-4-amino-4,6-dideoxygalactose transaminase
MMSPMIPFNQPTRTGHEPAHLRNLLDGNKSLQEGDYAHRCTSWLERRLGARKVFLTTSCTHALEMSALLAKIEPGDEVILPSFAFTSTANAFTLRGAALRFVDIRADTLNLDERLVLQAITPRTKAICTLHYAGIACDMDALTEIADRRHLLVIEDAAHAILSTYKGRPLGTLGTFGCFSFHETKNLHCGEGGALLVNRASFAERAEFIREKGTNRGHFVRGQVDKYTWVDLGSSYTPSELCSAFLFGQLEGSDDVLADRLASWRRYYDGLLGLVGRERLEVPTVPPGCEHNGHIFYVKTANVDERDRLLAFLAEGGTTASFHYIPLHSTDAGRRYGCFVGEDRYTTRESQRLLRLPLWHAMGSERIDRVLSQIDDFYRGGRVGSNRREGAR